MSTRDDESCDGQETSLGAYVLGKLSADERAVLEAHLAGCPGCRREHDEFQEVMAGLSLLSSLELEEALGEPDFVTPPVAAAPAPAAAPEATVSRPRRAAWAWRLLPTARPARAALAGALTLIIVIVGFTWFSGFGEPTDVSGVPYAAADYSSNDVSLSIRVYSAPQGVTVRGTVDGLTADQRYRLTAATLDQREHIVLEWTAVKGVQSLSGEIDVRPETLVLFAVSKLDGTVVVSAGCRPHPAD